MLNCVLKRVVFSGWWWDETKYSYFLPRVSPMIREFVQSVDDREWQTQLFSLLQSQSYNQCEVDTFELMCKVLDQNLFSQVDWARNTIFFKDLKVSVVELIPIEKADIGSTYIQIHYLFNCCITCIRLTVDGVIKIKVSEFMQFPFNGVCGGDLESKGKREIERREKRKKRVKQPASKRHKNQLDFQSHFQSTTWAHTHTL